MGQVDEYASKNGSIKPNENYIKSLFPSKLSGNGKNYQLNIVLLIFIEKNRGREMTHGFVGNVKQAKTSPLTPSSHEALSPGKNIKFR